MDQEKRFFDLSAFEFSHLIMMTMREAMQEIRSRRGKARVTEKGLTGSGKTDFVTDADFAAQELYAERFRSRFPGIGLIGEESGLSEPCEAPGGITLTLDPLDGTGAFVRGQSHGVATMIGVLEDDRLAGGFIGDVMTGEIYAAEPGREGAYHYEHDGSSRPLAPNGHTRLRNQYLLARHQPQRSGALAADLAAYGDDARLFDDVLVDSGSIGLHFARLWKGEVGGLLIEPSVITPWDQVPCYAISERLGIISFALEDPLRGIPFEAVETSMYCDSPLLYLPTGRVSEFLVWCNAMERRAR